MSILLKTFATVAALVIWLAPVELVAVTPVLPYIPPGVFYITNYGANGDGAFTNTTAIQAALDAAGAAGGGTVEVTAPGTFLCGPLAMHSHTRFQIDSGAVLRLLPYGQYPGTTPFIFCDKNQDDYEFCGPGVLDGQGKPWWDAGLGTSSRPYEIRIWDSSHIYIHDWNSTNPPMKHIIMDGQNDNITIQNVTNTAASTSLNTDGIDWLGSNCVITACTLWGGDDNVATGRSTGCSTDTLITNLTCGVGHGISFGSLLPPNGMSNVTVINCTISGGGTYGIRFKSDTNLANGCQMQNINVRNITINSVQRPIVIYSYYDSGDPGNVSPATAAAQPLSGVSDAPMWNGITFSNISGIGTVNSGLIWARKEMCASNITLQAVNISGPTPFNVYNARRVRLVDCNFTNTSRGVTYQMYNADVTISNSSPTGIRSVTLDGLTQGTTNWLSLYNAQAGLSNTNVLGNQVMLTMCGSMLLVTNHLGANSSSVFNFLLGTNAATVGVRNNLALAGTINIADGGGLTNGTYTLFTNGGAFTWNNPVIGSSPAGSTCTFDLGTTGQVNLVVTVPTQPAITNQPQSLTNLTGTTATFSVGAAGTPPPGYQWQFYGTNIMGAADSSLSLSNVQLTNAGNYTVVVTNVAGAVTSAVAVLKVLAPPAILDQQFLDGSFWLTFTGPEAQTYKILASTNVGSPMASWTVLTNGTFPVSVPFLDTSATNNQVKFYRVVSP